jgi:hypothetical protein
LVALQTAFDEVFFAYLIKPADDTAPVAGPPSPLFAETTLQRPLSDSLARQLLRWLLTDVIPLPSHTGDGTEGLKAVQTAHQVLLKILVGATELPALLTRLGELLMAAATPSQTDSAPDRTDSDSALTALCLAIVTQLGWSGLMALLGCGQSEGTQMLPPPSLEELWTAFHTPMPGIKPPHVPLTVGARAMCKHAVRSKDRYWGAASGSTPAKNEAATVMLGKILGDVVWMNVHALPPYTEACFEVRNSLGYGARWSLAPRATSLPLPSPLVLSFRGFLEPHYVQGHLTGWIH